MLAARFVARKCPSLSFPTRGALKPFARGAPALRQRAGARGVARGCGQQETAAMDERITGAVAVMNLNKDIMVKSASATLGAVNNLKGGVDKALDKAVGGVKADVGAMKADIKEAVRQEMASMKKVLRAELGALASVFLQGHGAHFLRCHRSLPLWEALCGARAGRSGPQAGWQVRG